jgi:hypothetical protein
MSHATFSSDPHPELPRAFRDPRKVADLAEKEPLSLSPPADEPEPSLPKTWRPKRLVRTCLSSMVDSHEFGRQMERESRKRRFFEAPARAFLGDGLPWNWSIQQTHFPDFTPVLDFTHTLSYIYAAAVVSPNDAATGWTRYPFLSFLGVICLAPIEVGVQQIGYRHVFAGRFRAANQLSPFSGSLRLIRIKPVLSSVVSAIITVAGFPPPDSRLSCHVFAPPIERLRHDDTSGVQRKGRIPCQNRVT